MSSLKDGLPSGKASGHSCPDCASRAARARSSKPSQQPLPQAQDSDSGPYLGIYAKTAAAPLVESPRLIWATDQETGETTPFRPADTQAGREYVSHVDPQITRLERFALKSVVNRLLPTSRTAKCMRWRVPKQKVQVLTALEYKKAFYKGLQVCGSVWMCPVCAAKISEKRRAELVSALAIAKARGWQVMLLTLTVPHGLGDDLASMLDLMMQAWRKTTSDRRGKALRKDLELFGTVRALEVTHGKNGWHPHFHVLLFLGAGVMPSKVQDSFAPLWQSVCVKVGLPEPSLAHGTRVDDGSYAAAYASKWGLESEMTKGHIKKGKQGGLTPFDLLRCYLDSKCQQSRRLFLVFAASFKGRRQLFWSNGLRELLGLNKSEMTDEEIASSSEENASLLSELTDDQWRAVLRTKSEAAVLNVAENTPHLLQDFLDGVLDFARSFPDFVVKIDK